MKPRLEFLSEELAKIKNDSLYRNLRFGTVMGQHITINQKKLINLCSNDYLGILPPSRLDCTQMQSSSRLVSGNDESYRNLEKMLAAHTSQQNALVFPTGYMANLGVITAIAKKNDVILTDQLNHASIIEACKLSGATVVIYKHGDTHDLDKKARAHQGRKFVITEGVFSMDGDLARLDEIVEIAAKNDIITVLDDAHGDFVMGKDGRGTANHHNVAKKIDVYVSSLSKGLGSFGGYIASQKNVIDYCVNRSRSFIYTSALPSILVKHATHRVQSNRSIRLKKLRKNTKSMINGLAKLGYPITSNSQIIPIIIGDERTALDFGRHLAGNGVFAQPIRYPTVAKKEARIRISVTAWLDEAHIQASLDAFEKAGRKFRVI